MPSREIGWAFCVVSRHTALVLGGRLHRERPRVPKDRDTQDLYFDTFSVRRSTSDDEADVGDELGAG